MQHLGLTREVFENVVWERGALLRPNLSETRLFSVVQLCTLISSRKFFDSPIKQENSQKPQPTMSSPSTSLRNFHLVAAQGNEVRAEGAAAAKFTDFAKIMWKVCQKGPFAQSVLMAKAALATALMSGLLAQPLLHINFSQSTSRFCMRIAECKDLLALPPLLLEKKSWGHQELYKSANGL